LLPPTPLELLLTVEDDAPPAPLVTAVVLVLATLVELLAVSPPPPPAPAGPPPAPALPPPTPPPPLVTLVALVVAVVIPVRSTSETPLAQAATTAKRDKMEARRIRSNMILSSVDGSASTEVENQMSDPTNLARPVPTSTPPLGRWIYVIGPRKSDRIDPLYGSN